MNFMTSEKTADDFVASMVSSGRISREAARRLMAAYAETGQPFDTVVVELGLMREDVLASELSNYFQTSLVGTAVDIADLTTMAPQEVTFLETHAIIPLANADRSGRIVYLVADPFDHASLEMVSYRTEKAIAIQIAARNQILTFFTSSRASKSSKQETEFDSTEAAGTDLERLKDFASQAPIIRLVSKVCRELRTAKRRMFTSKQPQTSFGSASGSMACLTLSKQCRFPCSQESPLG